MYFNIIRNLSRNFHLRISCFSAVFAAILSFVLSLDATESSVNAQGCSNGVPNISARHNPNSRSFDVFTNFIFWTAKEAGADNWAEVIISDDLTSSNEILQVDFGWDPGFRVGIGYGMRHDQWDTQAFYTWFYTVGEDVISSEPGAVHSTFLGNFYVDNPDGTGLSGPSYQSANIDWTIRFNIFDWELGRKYWISKALYMRPFLGIKGGWIYQFIHSKWQNPDLSGSAFFNVGTENLENNFWGIGPGAGIKTQWDLFNGQSQFYLFGDFSGALMWGHWSFSDLFQNDLSQQVSVNLQDINSGASTIRTFMGFGCNVHFCRNRYRFSSKLGYELQFWLDQLQFYSFTGGRLVNVLTLQGGTFELCFDF